MSQSPADVTTDRLGQQFSLALSFSIFENQKICIGTKSLYRTIVLFVKMQMILAL